MRKMLKVLSVLEIVLGLLCGVIAVAGLALGGLIGGAAELSAEQQVVILVKVSSAVGLVSALFNLACGFSGWKGANGDEKKLSQTVVLGWVGLIAGAVSAVMTIAGNVSADRIFSALAGMIVPALFLAAAKSAQSGR